MKLNKAFSRAANTVATATGRPAAFMLCVAIVVVWGVTGPLFKYSDTWQLVINTGTTIITFLMVFLIQNTQNRDGLAIQTKLDELIRASDAEDEFMGIEKLTDKQLDALHAKCQRMSTNSQRLLDQASKERDSRDAARRKSKSSPAPKARAKA